MAAGGWLAACGKSNRDLSSGPAGFAITAGASHACGLSNGTVKCWGRNTFGQLGNATTADSSVPVVVSGITTATALAAGGGGDHTCARLTDATVACWGRNDSGQLGTGTLTSVTTPVAVSGISTATTVAAGAAHTCAILSDGMVQCWGSNSRGQLGQVTVASSSTPVTVPLVTTATAVAIGSEHTCALLSDGTVRCWGANGVGQLGRGAFDTSQTASNPNPVNVTRLTTIANGVTAGGSHSCAWLLDGTVKCWGLNSSGQLGNRTNTGPEQCGTQACSSSPVTVSGIPTATAVAVGWTHTCARLADSTLQCWGSNSKGQLGNNTQTDSTTAVVVSGISAATTAAAGTFHTCVRLLNETVRCWGSNTYGQLGNGTTADSLTPVTVVATGF